MVSYSGEGGILFWLTARGNVELGILTGNMEKRYWQFKKQTLEMIKPHILGFSFWNIRTPTIEET